MLERFDPANEDLLEQAISELREEAKDAARRGRIFVLETREEARPRKLQKHEVLFPVEPD